MLGRFSVLVVRPSLIRLASLDSFPRGEALTPTAIGDGSSVYNLFTHSITVQESVQKEVAKHRHLYRVLI